MLKKNIWKLGIVSFTAMPLTGVVSCAHETHNSLTNITPEINKLDNKEYTGYIYQKYLYEVWPKMYSDFSILNKKLPFINIKYISHAKGEWEPSLLTDDFLWKGIITPEEWTAADTDEKRNKLKEKIINETSIEEYAVNIDGYVFHIFFDAGYNIPDYMRRKIVTDLLCYKQWSYQIFTQEGFMVAGGRLVKRGGSSGGHAAYMTPFSPYSPNPSKDFMTSYKNYKSINRLMQGIYHEFGHQIIGGSDTGNESFINSNHLSQSSKKYINLFKKQGFVAEYNFALIEKYGKMKNVNLSDIYPEWSKGHPFEDITNDGIDGPILSYAYSMLGEYLTELNRMFDEVPFFEKTTFFDPFNAFTSSESTRELAMLEVMGNPLWDKDTKTLTPHGELYRQDFNKYLLGLSDDMSISNRILVSAFSNNKPAYTIVGSVPFAFDLIKGVNDMGDEDIFSLDDIHKLGKGHANLFKSRTYFSREKEKIEESRVSFMGIVRNSQFYNRGTTRTLHFYQDTNNNGILDPTDKEVATKNY